MQFREISGNNELKQKLMEIADSGKMSHSIMLVEQPGCGAIGLATALVQYMACPNHIQGKDSCGVCPTCKKIARGFHQDLHYVFPVNTSPISAQKSDPRQISRYFAEPFRELLSSNPYFTESDLYSHLQIEEKSGNINVAQAKDILAQLSLKSYEGFNKYMIVWLPERMNEEAANRLLKIVEEPSPGTYFIFITHSPDKVLQTIRSRTLMMKVFPVESELISRELCSRSGITENDAMIYARACGGSIGKAIRLCREAQEGSLFFPIVQRIIECRISRDLPGMLECADSIVDLGRERQKEFCRYLTGFYRKILMEGIGLPSISDTLPNEQPIVTQACKVLSRTTIQKSVMAAEEAASDIESNANSKIAFCHLVNLLYTV